jgi:hypothetical protein
MSEVLNNGMIFAMAKPTSTGWSINGFLTNLNSSLFSWGKIIVVILGVIMVLAGLFQIGKGLMSGGRSQTNWVVAIALFFLGGALAFSGGWGLVQSVAQGGAQTLNDLGTGQTATSIFFDAMQMLH